MLLSRAFNALNAAVRVNPNLSHAKHKRLKIPCRQTLP
jgi:hypothetical protein